MKTKNGQCIKSENVIALIYVKRLPETVIISSFLNNQKLLIKIYPS